MLRAISEMLRDLLPETVKPLLVRLIIEKSALPLPFVKGIAEGLVQINDRIQMILFTPAESRA